MDYGILCVSIITLAVILMDCLSTKPKRNPRTNSLPEKVEIAYRTNDLEVRAKGLQQLKDEYGVNPVEKALSERYKWAQLNVYTEQNILIEPQPQWDMVDPNLIPPSEWAALIEKAPFVGEFHPQDDSFMDRVDNKGFVVYDLWWHNYGHYMMSLRCDSCQFVLGFAATGDRDVDIYMGTMKIETIDSVDIRKGMPVTLDDRYLYYFAFKVPINRAAFNFYAFRITEVVTIRCVRFMDEHLYDERYKWSSMTTEIPLYKRQYIICKGHVGTKYAE